MRDFRPLSDRVGRAPAGRFAALHDGVPAWLVDGVAGWMSAALGALVRDYGRGAPAAMQASLRQVLRSDLFDGYHERVEWELVESEPELALDVLDYLLRLNLGRVTASGLESLLAAGGSKWRATDRGLEERVLSGATDAFEVASSPGDRAANYLRDAWHSVYGREPDPSGGYANAVRSVEAAARTVVSPNDSKATLGKMRTAMRDAPQKWTVALGGDDSQVSSVMGMLSMLWEGQHDRHGDDDDSKPLRVSLEEARAAVHLAVVLVQWFRSGVVT